MIIGDRKLSTRGDIPEPRFRIRHSLTSKLIKHFSPLSFSLSLSRVKIVARTFGKLLQDNPDGIKGPSQDPAIDHQAIRGSINNALRFIRITNAG